MGGKIMQVKILTIIPARGGSKGILCKNIRLVAGKPLIAWSVEAAKASCYVQTLYVSTDDPEIANVAKDCGADVLKRPKELAGDRTQMIDVILYVLDQCEALHATTYDYFLLLQPTAPMRTGGDIDAALETLLTSGADSVISVYKVEDVHPARMYMIKDDYLEPFYQEPVGSLRQDLPAVYHRNGAIYACKRQLLVEQGRLWGGRIMSYIMPKERSTNIDDEQDLLIADFLLSQPHILERKT